jgi:Ni/Fe-hydrogenase subunit HybB-like protein
MLIWYGNIAEEGEYYFLRRFHFSQFLFTFNIIINFFVPFLILLPNKLAKNPKVLVSVAVLVLIGLFLDVYLSVFPPLVHTFQGVGEHTHPVFSIYEIGIFLGFLGIFIFAIFTKMAKREHILPINHPYLEESLMHHNAH